jgi:peptidyl-tRNA hydrolase, PTH2 family
MDGCNSTTRYKIVWMFPGYKQNSHKHWMRIMKLAVVVRKDLGMRTGKIAVQVAHAAIAAYINSPANVRDKWYEEGQKKIVLKAQDKLDLLRIGYLAECNKLHIEQIIDFGLTQVEPDTLTCIAIGIDENEKIDVVTKGLQLL